MMNAILNVLHPTFEALSAHADAKGADAAESRTGRHVARCEACRQTVSDIRQIGDQARAIVVGDAPADLWERIDSRRSARGAYPVTMLGTTAEREMTGAAVESTDDVLPGTVSQFRSRGFRALALVATAAAIVVALTLPAKRSLEASGVSRFTFSPGRAIPGRSVTVRYRPNGGLKDARQLVLAGRYLHAGHSEIPTPWSSENDLMLVDSLAVLTPTESGIFEGKLLLPTDFQAVRLAVVDPANGKDDTDGYFLWGILGASASGAPSLAAMLTALAGPSNLWMNGNRMPDHFSEGVVDSMTKYFPSHPAGWAAKQDYGVRKGVFDYFAFFQTAERKYAQLYEKLMPQAHLDADRIAHMIVFSNRIEEPRLAAEWTRRLYKEHPQDPRLFLTLGDMLHSIELRTPPHYQDSLRPWIPALLGTYRNDEYSLPWNSEGTSIIRLYGDDAQKAAFERMALAKGVAPERVRGLTGRWTKEQADSAARQVTPSDERKWRETVARGCRRPVGKYPLFGDFRAWTAACLNWQADAMTGLSRIYLLRGDGRSAIALADSALALERQADGCGGNWWKSGASLASARARAAVGDTEGAMKAIALKFGTQKGLADSLSIAVLGSRADGRRMKSLVDSLTPIVSACHKEREARRTAELRIWKARM